jgi:hypothetical protein
MKRILFSCLLLTACASAPPDDSQVKTHRTAITASGTCGTPDNSTLSYGGGPVIHGTFNVYLIYYGNFSDVAPVNILNNLVSNIGGSPYWAINTSYGATNSVRLGGALVTGTYSQGTDLDEGNIAAVIQQAINDGRFPVDTNGLYVVVGDPNVTAHTGSWPWYQHYCSDFCGYHDHGSISNADLKFAFIGDPRQCQAQGMGNVCACTNINQSPNYSPAGDTMASVLAHEMDETATDPDENAWVSGNYENADHCVYTYGATQTAANGSVYNITLGGKQYLIQQNLTRTGVCGMSCSDGGLTFCSGNCVNTANDITNCGGCGNICPADYTCSGGSCQPPAGCPPGTNSCCGGDICARVCPRQCP